MAEPAGVLVTGVAMALPTVLHNATHEWAGMHAKQHFTRHKQLSREPGGGKHRPARIALLTSWPPLQAGGAGSQSGMA